MSIIIEQFIALPCWAVVAGEGTGSMVNLVFGSQIPRDKPLANQPLSKLYRFNRSDYSVFIQSATWLLERNDVEICSSASDNSNSGPMVMGLSNLLNMHIHDMEYIPEQGLYIDFQNDYTLSVFFEDEEFQKEELDYLTVFCPEASFTINSTNNVEINVKN